ncbi:MAG: GlsB/YeaQ/YmgE family stress response membrane protein, partial [Rhodanobacter sp.]|nr:GlsB/YeaQ/YmgE family stress response membrane protein [Rhodanobacter sp.]
MIRIRGACVTTLVFVQARITLWSWETALSGDDFMRLRGGPVANPSRPLHTASPILSDARATWRHLDVIRRVAEDHKMTGTELIIILLVGALAGWLAGVIVRGFGFGLLGNTVIGILGAFFAGWLFPRVGLHFMLVNPLVTSIAYAMLGAVILLVII